MITRLSDDYTPIGDVNCNILEPYKEPKLGRHLLNLCDDYNLKSLVSGPTRATAKSDTLIDVILTSKRIEFLHTGVFNPDISDHHLVCAITRARCPKRGPKTSMRRKFTRFDSIRYNGDVVFTPFHVANTFKDINDVYWA